MFRPSTKPFCRFGKSYVDHRGGKHYISPIMATPDILMDQISLPKHGAPSANDYYGKSQSFIHKEQYLIIREYRSGKTVILATIPLCNELDGVGRLTPFKAIQTLQTDPCYKRLLKTIITRGRFYVNGQPCAISATIKHCCSY